MVQSKPYLDEYYKNILYKTVFRNKMIWSLLTEGGIFYQTLVAYVFEASAFLRAKISTKTSLGAGKADESLLRYKNLCRVPEGQM